MTYRVLWCKSGATVSDIPPSLYRRRDLSLFVVSRFVANCAMQIQSVAIGWQIYDMVRTPLALGLVGLCQFVPMFLLTLPAGDMGVTPHPPGFATGIPPRAEAGRLAKQFGRR